MPDTEGGEITTLARKPMAMMASKPVMTRSNGRCPRRSCTSSSPIETTPVITPPTTSGSPNSSFSAIAPPTTSARSVAIATVSA